LWELSTREEVYKGLESTQIIAKVANEGLRPPVPKRCPWNNVMTKCWAENPHDRMGFNEVVVELNRISRELDEENEKVLICQNLQHQTVLEAIAEETPLIKATLPGGQKNLYEQDEQHQIEDTLLRVDGKTLDGGRKNKNVLWNMLRQKKQT